MVHAARLKKLFLNMDTQARNGWSGRSYVWILLFSAAVVFSVSLFSHLYAQSLVFLVEGACDPNVQECYVRDCELEECPPNELSEYRVFAVSTKDFEYCEDNACANICAHGTACEEILCSDDGEATCEGPLEAAAI